MLEKGKICLKCLNWVFEDGAGTRYNPPTTKIQNYLKDWVGNKHGISNCIWEGWRELTLISCCIFVVGILKHLTDVLELRDFLQILPDEGNMLFFLPYITECQEKEKSKQLLNTIRKKGEHLQHYIWYLLICVVKVHVLD